MTYLQFHLLFILPPLAVLLAMNARAAHRGRWGWRYLLAICVIALVYTTPWDNYLVWRGVWGYGEDRVAATIGYVPVEEYLFFLLQPLLAGSFFYLADQRIASSPGTAPRRTVALLYLVGTVAGVWLLTTERGLYAGLILAWAAPVLLGQWYLAADSIWSRRGAILAGVGIPTVYLWFADAVAIGSGIWEITEETRSGIQLGILPVEEMLFFLVTNILVVQGLALFLGPVRDRAAVVDRRVPARR